MLAFPSSVLFYYLEHLDSLILECQLHLDIPQVLHSRCLYLESPDMAWILNAVALLTALIPSLSQDLTNGSLFQPRINAYTNILFEGLSSYGTLECQTLPLYLGSTVSSALRK
jgi:hypothetical protein